MCNLTTVRKSAAEVARHFRVRTPPDVALNVPEETLPGYPGMVIREADGDASCSPWCGSSRCA